MRNLLGRFLAQHQVLLGAYQAWISSHARQTHQPMMRIWNLGSGAWILVPGNLGSPGSSNLPCSSLLFVGSFLLSRLLLLFQLLCVQVRPRAGMVKSSDLPAPSTTIQTSSAGQWGTRSPPLLSQSSASDLLLLLLGLSLPEAVPSSARSSKLSEPHLWSGRSVHLVSPLLLLGGLRRW